MKRLVRVLWVACLALVLMGASAKPIAAQPCDQACLTKVMDGFLAAMTTGKTASISLAQDAEIRENAKLITLDATAWKQVKAVRSIMTFADPVTANVVSRAGVELADGKPGYISTRLKVADGGRVTDVELSADTSSRVVSSYVWKLDSVYSSVLPAEQRMTRIGLEALARRYFHSLSSHQAVAEDYDAGCNRFHSGQQITNAGSNTVEGGLRGPARRRSKGTRRGGPRPTSAFLSSTWSAASCLASRSSTTSRVRRRPRCTFPRSSRWLAVGSSGSTTSD